MRKGPGFHARFFGRRDTNWLGFLAHRIRTPQPASKMGAYTLSPATSKEIKRLMVEFDFAEVEKRGYYAERAYTFDEYMDFEKAAGITLASINPDPRNHFGKYVLRRFDNE